MDKKDSRPEQDRDKAQKDAQTGAAAQPQEEGSLKVHGDKLEKRSDKQSG